MGRIVQRFERGDPAISLLAKPRDDLVGESEQGDGVYMLEHGPFRSYERRVAMDANGDAVQTIEYTLAVPWFAFLFAWPVRRTLRRPPEGTAQPWWAPPDRLSARQANVLGLLAAASLIIGYVNTLFTQTVNFAADEFGVSDTGKGVAAAIVRVGIIVTLPIVFLADRVGRRRMIVFAATAAPLVAALGALSPSFAVLTGTQTLGRPLGLALDVLVAVVAAEEMPRSSRTYAISLLAMASGLGAGFCVIALPLADLGTRGWRLVYVLPLFLMFVSRDLARRLPETRRFEEQHAITPHVSRHRFVILAVAAFLGNLFVAPASLYQNSYLSDVRGYPARLISTFTIVTSTPAGLGILAGGRIADARGRRLLGGLALLAGVAFAVLSFTRGGWIMWVSALLAGLFGGASYPALSVYRTELFPTARRSGAGGLLTASALVGGSIGLIVTGQAVDRGWPYGSILGTLALGSIAVTALVLTQYPETAHRELEEINPEDRPTPAERPI
jgi:MFS family permease